jgi:hypothetical protein
VKAKRWAGLVVSAIVGCTAPVGAEPAQTCGGLEELPQAKKPAEVLAGRLRLRPPRPFRIVRARSGSRPARSTSAVAPPTYLHVKAGEHDLTIFVAEEMGLWTEPGARTFASGAREIRLPSGLRAFLPATPKVPAQIAGKFVLLNALVVSPDQTVQRVAMSVSPAPATGEEGGCVALADRILATVEPGPRKLDLSGGERDLGMGLRVTLPSGWVVLSEGRHGGRVHHIQKMLPMGQSAWVQIAVGSAPDDHLTDLPSSQTESRMVFGQKVSFTVFRDGREHRHAVVGVPGADSLKMIVTVATDDESQATEAVKIVESMKRSAR